ncbi:MAG: inositol monophosphatase [Candidatus Pacebacteria bacterium]|nr:inositol monophosphatase [Candidatus Paceibacterota bacterium]
MLNTKILNTALKAVKESGKMLIKEYENFDRNKVSFKARNEILTKADLKSEKQIITTIKKGFPKHQILAEESGKSQDNSDYLWIIDPIDGTTNFSMHNPLWSISLALAYKKDIILGIVYLPYLNELFVAKKNKGATMNNKKIKVSKNIKDNVINTYCHARDKKYVNQAIKYYIKQKTHGLDCRQLGSAAIELAYVASGRIESITIPGANSWDVAAGALLVKEAGGRVTDFKNKSWNLKSENIVASNGKVHSQIIKVL